MRPRRAEGTRRTDIADAILAVAGREGVGALTMERLGRELGVTSGALFRHFPTRSAMLDAAAERAVGLLESTFPSEELPPIERLRTFVAARAHLAASHAGLPQLVLSEQFGKALPPRGARAVRGVVLRTRDFVAEALREGAARGEVRSDIPPEELALAVIGVIVARALFAALLGGGSASPPDPEMAWRHLTGLIRPPRADRPGRRSSAKGGQS